MISTEKCSLNFKWWASKCSIGRWPLVVYLMYRRFPEQWPRCDHSNLLPLIRLWSLSLSLSVLTAGIGLNFLISRRCILLTEQAVDEDGGMSSGEIWFGWWIEPWAWGRGCLNLDDAFTSFRTIDHGFLTWELRTMPSVLCFTKGCCEDSVRESKWIHVFLFPLEPFNYLLLVAFMLLVSVYFFLL